MAGKKTTKTVKRLKVSDNLLEWLETLPDTGELPSSGPAELDYIRDPSFVAGSTIAQFVEDVHTAMLEAGLNKNTLAEKLGYSRQYVGRILNETANFTIRTMAELSAALEVRLVVRLIRKEQRFAVMPQVSFPCEVTKAFTYEPAKTKSRGGRTQFEFVGHAHLDIEAANEAEENELAFTA